MPSGHRCCIIGCKATSHKRDGTKIINGLSFFVIPKVKQHLGETVTELTTRRRLAWISAIRRPDVTFERVTYSFRVCSNHFHKGAPSYEMMESDPDWVPSLNLGHGEVKPTSAERHDRRQRRLNCNRKMESTESITHAAFSLSLEDFTFPQADKDGVLRIPVHAVNPHLICGLCQGYLYEACTITECMHSFCKSCLVKHLQRSLNCPMCAILIHPTDPFVHIRLDGLLQDIVYALLPQVEKNEVEKERLFYEKHGGYKRHTSQHETRRSAAPKPSNLSRHPPSISKVSSQTQSSYPQSFHTPSSYTPPVALNLQCLEANNKSHELVKPFVHVTGGTTIQNLTRFLRKKLQITDSHKVDLYCPCTSGLVCLSDSHTLKAVKDLYCHDADIVQLNYEIREP